MIAQDSGDFGWHHDPRPDGGSEGLFVSRKEGSVAVVATGKAVITELMPVMRERMADLETPVSAYAKLRALGWNIMHLGETFAIRRTIQRNRALPDSAVFARGSSRWFPPTALAGHRRRPQGGAAPSNFPPANHESADDRL